MNEQSKTFETLKCIPANQEAEESNIPLSQSRQFLNSESCQSHISVKEFSFLQLMTCTWLRQVMVRSRVVPAPKLHPKKQETCGFGSPAPRPPAHLIRLQPHAITLIASTYTGKLLVQKLVEDGK